MNDFKKYTHLERFGTSETEGIEIGTCHVFPKIDGTNASVWYNGSVNAGSRNRHLSCEADNAGFCEWASNYEPFQKLFADYPSIRLYGEWLVPHSLKTYRESAWRKFYCFDVEECDKLLHYEAYKPILELYGIEYIPPICVIRNGSYEQFVSKLAANVYLIEDGKGAGEGIVIKNYGFQNRFGRNCYAKIVTSEFKEKHAKEMGGGEVNGKKMIEEEIVAKYVTVALCEKEHAKIEIEAGEWNSKMIPRLLQTVFYNLVKEDAWEFVKEHKYPVINFKTLMHFCNIQVKANLPKVFS